MSLLIRCLMCGRPFGSCLTLRTHYEKGCKGPRIDTPATVPDHGEDSGRDARDSNQEVTDA